MAEYDSYLLRIWRSRRAGRWAWALRLEHLQDGEVQRFDDPAALVEALWARAEAERYGGSESSAASGPKVAKQGDQATCRETDQPRGEGR